MNAPDDLRSNPCDRISYKSAEIDSGALGVNPCGRNQPTAMYECPSRPATKSERQNFCRSAEIECIRRIPTKKAPPLQTDRGYWRGGFLSRWFLLSQKCYFWTFQKSTTFWIFFIRFFSHDDFCLIATKQSLGFLVRIPPPLVVGCCETRGILTKIQGFGTRCCETRGILKGGILTRNPSDT